MKATSLREQTAEELVQHCHDSVRELLELKSKKGIGDASEQPLKVRTLRRDLARIKTVMKEKGISENV